MGPPRESPPRTPDTDRALAEERKASAELARLAEQVVIVGRRRNQAILVLRDAGWSYQQIADALGVARGRAQALVRDARQQVEGLAKDSTEPEGNV